MRRRASAVQPAVTTTPGRADAPGLLGGARQPCGTPAGGCPVERAAAASPVGRGGCGDHSGDGALARAVGACRVRRAAVARRPDGSSDSAVRPASFWASCVGAAAPARASRQRRRATPPERASRARTSSASGRRSARRVEAKLKAACQPPRRTSASASRTSSSAPVDGPFRLQGRRAGESKRDGARSEQWSELRLRHLRAVGQRAAAAAGTCTSHRTVPRPERATNERPSVRPPLPRRRAAGGRGRRRAGAATERVTSAGLMRTSPPPAPAAAAAAIHRRPKSQNRPEASIRRGASVNQRKQGVGTPASSTSSLGPRPTSPAPRRFTSARAAAPPAARRRPPALRPPTPAAMSTPSTRCRPRRGSRPSKSGAGRESARSSSSSRGSGARIGRADAITAKEYSQTAVRAAKRHRPPAAADAAPVFWAVWSLH